jgi:hypothetical protein
MEITVMSKISGRIASLKSLVSEIEADAAKTDNGNKAASTRVRKGLSEVAKLVKEIRQEVLEVRDATEKNSAE